MIVRPSFSGPAFSVDRSAIAEMAVQCCPSRIFAVEWGYIPLFNARFVGYLWEYRHIVNPNAETRFYGRGQKARILIIKIIRSERHHFCSNVCRCRCSVLTLFFCTTLSWSTTFRTNTHSSFDFNFFAFNPWELYIQGYKKIIIHDIVEKSSRQTEWSTGWRRQETKSERK